MGLKNGQFAIREEFKIKNWNKKCNQEIFFLSGQNLELKGEIGDIVIAQAEAKNTKLYFAAKGGKKRKDKC